MLRFACIRAEPAAGMKTGENPLPYHAEPEGDFCFCMLVRFDMRELRPRVVQTRIFLPLVVCAPMTRT